MPVVLRDAPLGTYVGWNIVADGFYKGGSATTPPGMIPFATTQPERTRQRRSAPSLEERYKDHAGYVQAVRTRRRTR